MSRTTRRTTGIKPRWVGTDWDYFDGHFRRYKLTGKALKKDLAKYHGDHGYGRYTGKCRNGSDEKGLRSFCKEQLQLWKRNPDFEVQISTKRYLRDYWD